MKATKKIVGAACALVAAVALSAGSTFAWFASNNTVTASGMHVQATVPTNLYIESGYIANVDGVSKSAITLTTSADALNPVAISATEPTGATIKDGATAETVSEKLFVLASDTYSKDPEAGSSGTVATYSTMGTLKPDAAAVTGAGAGWTGESKGETGTYDQKDYVYSADMTLANKSTNKIDIDATVTISWTVSTDTIKFLRVGFLVGSSNEGTWSYKFVSLGNDIASGEGSAITTGTNYVYDATKSTVTVEYSKLIDEFDGNTVRTITFLAWFDGNDSECYVDNAISVSELNLSVEYNAVKPNESGD